MSRFRKTKVDGQARRSPALLEALEPRLLYSADLIGGVIDGNSFEPALDNELELETILPATTETARPNDTDKQESSQARIELVVIDAATPDYQLLVDDIVNRSDSGVQLEIALLNSQQDGISQINQVLADYQELDAIHLVSHGTEGAILLGDSLLNQQSLDQYAETLTSWQGSLSDDADLLIYGCNLAADDVGQALIEQLSTLTGADVAASDDVTGHSLLRGDWELEQQRGSIETAIAFSEELQQSWSGILPGPPNSPPTASDNTITFAEDSVYTFTAEDFGFADADPGDELSLIRITSLESVGELKLGGGGGGGGDIITNQVITRAQIDQGLLTFTPLPGGNGDSYDSFSFVVKDDKAFSDNDYTMTIDVMPNDAPVAVADSFTVDEGSSTTLNLAGNDSDADDGLDLGSITIVGAASHGSVVVNANGTVDYTHDGSETVSDSFTYTIKDTHGAISNTVTVDLVVTPVNDSPVAQDATETTGENTVLNGNVPAATDVDGTVASYQLVGDVAEGSLVFNPDGSYSFTPGSAFDDLAAGASRDVTFTYTATDNDGGVSGAKTITITVTGTNDVPVAQDGTETSGENTVLNGNVPAATDVDGTVASYQLVGDVAEGSLAFNPDGSYTFTPGSAFDDLAAGASRDVTFTYTATDNDGGVSGAKTVTITVTGTNDVPVAQDAAETSGENAMLSGNVPAATDVDSTVASYQLVGDVAEGSLAFNPDGSYSFTPGSAFDDLAAGASRDVTFTYTATDNDGGVSGAKTVTITVTGTNDAPVVGDNSQATQENTVLNGNVPAATDVDGTVASYQLAGDVAEGSLVFNPDGSYSFTPGSAFDDLAAGASRDVSFTYTATDNDGGVSGAKTVTITVTGTNDAPVAQDAAETSGKNAVLSGNVPAASDVDGTVASYQLVGDVAEGSLAFNPDGSYTFTPGSAFDDLPAGASRDVIFTYTATDNDGGVSGAKTVTITVTGTNDVPVVQDDSQATQENTVLNGNVPAASDVDGTVASYQLVGDVAEGSLVFNPDGSYSFTPGSAFDDLPAGASRDVSFTYTATDNDGGVSGAKTVTITVTGTNDAPVVQDDSQATQENTVLNGNVPAASDVDGTVVSYQLVGDVAEGSLAFNPDGSYSFTPGSAFDDLAAGASRDVTFTYTATDNDGGVSGAKTITITVTGTNDVPVAQDTAETSGENTVLNGNVPVATDVDGTVASYQLVGDVAEGSLAFNPDGSYSFTPGSAFDDLAAGASRDVTFTYTATDNDGGVSGAKTVTITVTGTNDAPVVGDNSQATQENTVLNGNVPAATDVDGTVASYQLVGDVAEGSLAFNPDGSYTFTPGSAFDDLPAGASRDVIFTYTATDNDGGGSGAKTVTITVTGTNDVPVVQDDSQATQENTVLNGNVPAASDVDGTVASYQLVGDVAEGSLAFNPDGSYTFTPGSAFDDLAAGASRDVTFTYTATDNDGGVSGAKTVTITVTGTNDAPVIGGVDSGSVTEDVDPDADTLVETSGTMTIADPDADESSFVAGTVNGSYGDLVIDSAGNWSYSVDNTQAAIQQLDKLDTLTETLAVTTADGTSHDVELTIHGTEDAPVLANAVADQTATEGEVFSFTFAANTFSDADASDTLTYTVTLADGSALPGWLTFDDATRTFSGTPTNGDVGVLNLKLIVYDGSSSVAETFAITVSTSSDVPVIGGQNTGITATTSEDSTINPEIDELPISIAPEPLETDDELLEPEVTQSEPITNSNINSNVFFSAASFELISGEVNEINAEHKERINEIVISKNNALESIDLNNLDLVPIESTLTEHAQVQPVHDNDTFLRELDGMRRDLNQSIEAEEQGVNVVSEVIMGGTLSLSVGVVSWVLRTGSLMASFLSVVPLWKQFDLVPILGNSNPQDAKSGEDEAVPEYLGEEDRIFGSRDDKHD